MRRIVNKAFVEWACHPRRKPLLLRGARQVGKTYAVEALAKTEFNGHMVKIDFEKMPAFAKIFIQDLDVKRIVSELEFATGQAIIPGETLLFLDEIQHCPRAIMALRYFYEELPALHVIAAGSLLEFAFSDISFPVGRIQFLHMHPLNFIEYLMAIGRENLAQLIQEPPQRLSDTIHELLRQELYRYFIIGGMPEAVKAYVDTGAIRESQAVHSELVNAFRKDFSKYAPRANKLCLEEVFVSVAKNVGQQIKYTHLAQDFSGVTIKQAFSLLSMAQVITPIKSCHPPILPLGASVKNKIFKAAVLDIGVMQFLCGFPMTLHDLDKNLLSIYRGALAEQFVAQELKMTQEEGELYYWQRAEKSSSAEVDYLAIRDNQVIPLEVKSGPAGKLKSMHLFLQQYSQSPYGYVFLDGPYQVLEEQKLVFMPLYYVYSAFTTAASANGTS